MKKPMEGIEKYTDDRRTVMTLDAGGTNLVFTAMQGCRAVTDPVRMPSAADNLQQCLATIVEGFRICSRKIGEQPVAISFAFPGPADYKAGIIGDLPNFPAFRGGVALGPYLQRAFGVPVFINNDGNLFAYGEYMAGSLPLINARLRESGCRKQFGNLISVTLGTGFGMGVVTEGRLLFGDNGCGGDIWCFRNGIYHDLIAEESVSIRAVCREYAALSGDRRTLTPKDIFDIAGGMTDGDRDAAEGSFAMLGRAAADALASVITVIDGPVSIGGGLSGASKYYMPALIDCLRSTLATHGGARFPRLQTEVFNLDDPDEFNRFASVKNTVVEIPGSDEAVEYDNSKRIGVVTAHGSTSHIISTGAYIYALNNL